DSDEPATPPSGSTIGDMNASMTLFSATSSSSSFSFVAWPDSNDGKAEGGTSLATGLHASPPQNGFSYTGRFSWPESAGRAPDSSPSGRPGPASPAGRDGPAATISS